MSPTRTTLVAAATIALLAVSLPATTGQTPPNLHLPDRVTAKIDTLNGITHHILRTDASGNYSVNVWVFAKSGAVWSQVSTNATLHVIAPNADNVLGERYTLAFLSQSMGPNLLTVPRSAVQVASGTPIWMDFVVSVEGLGLDPVPEVRHNQAKNLLIDLKQYDAADAVDYWSGVGALGLP